LKAVPTMVCCPEALRTACTVTVSPTVKARTGRKLAPALASVVA
jgi:hypothetical protein